MHVEREKGLGWNHWREDKVIQSTADVARQVPIETEWEKKKARQESPETRKSKEKEFTKYETKLSIF